MTFLRLIQIESVVLLILWDFIFIAFRTAHPRQSPVKDLLDSLIVSTGIVLFFTFAFFLGYFGIQPFVR
jgi:uncharacterized membrane protein